MIFRGPQKVVTFAYGPGGIVLDAFAPSKGPFRTSCDVMIGERSASDVAEQCLIQYDKIESSTVAIWMDGQYSNRSGATLAPPLRIEWKLFLGVNGCMPDDDPLKGVTILQGKDFEGSRIVREGLLFQINSHVAQTMWLCGRIIDPVGTLQLQLSLRTIFWPLTGRPEAIVGTAIG